MCDPAIFTSYLSDVCLRTILQVFSYRKCSFPRTSIRASLHVCQFVARLGLGRSWFVPEQTGE